jgi:hypothetical protein
MFNPRLRLIALLVAFCTLCMAVPAAASGIEVRAATLESTDDGYAVHADFDVDLTPRVEEALNSGVSLYFVVEFELIRPRWYWFDQRTVVSRLQYRLTYHALSRQYRLWTGTFHQPFASLSEALRVLGRVRSWHVLELNQVEIGQRYETAVRMQLDQTQLPRPFQLSALTSREWTMESAWLRFPFMPRAPVSSRRTDEGGQK